MAAEDVSPRPTDRASTTRSERRDNWLLAVVSLAAVSLIGTVVAVGLAFRFADEGGATAVSTSGGGGGEVEFDIELGDLYVKPKSIDVPAGAEITLNVTNAGAMAHDLKVNGENGTEMLDPGATETVVVGPFDTSTQAWCTVPGHREAGMEMDINVVGDAGDAATADHTTHATGAAATEGGGTGAQIDFAAEPAGDWKPFDPVLQPAPGATEHKIDMSAEETVLEVAPGVTQELWTFNQQSPGPILRGKVGDVFTVTITNNGKIGHSMDFHASKVAMSDEMRTLQPGESIVYQFEAKHAGAWMYHCGTAPTLHHIGNGMFGAIIIDPPDLPEVDHEFVFVQSEIYTGAEGQPGDLTKMQNEAWDAVVFNGYVNQYAHAPIDTVDPDQRVRVWVVDAGPSENSSFHIVGTIFDTVYKEGNLLLSPDETKGGSQALDLQPAQGGYVEFTFDEPGVYVGVTHKFANVGKGAQIVFHVGEFDMEGAPGGH